MTDADHRAPRPPGRALDLARASSRPRSTRCGIDARYEAWDIARRPTCRSPSSGCARRDCSARTSPSPTRRRCYASSTGPTRSSSASARLNTIVRRDGQLHATNTDVTGILTALADAGVDVRGAPVSLLGAGGAARAVVVAMRSAGASMAHDRESHARPRASRSPTLGGDELPVDAVHSRGGRARTSSRRCRGADRRACTSTSLGMRHGPDRGGLARARRAVPARSGRVRPRLRTRSARRSSRPPRRAGARTLGGLAMLVHQGAEAFRLWTGVEPPLRGDVRRPPVPPCASEDGGSTT